MNKSRKIVFLDIDGTLTNRVNHIPHSARTVCRGARKNGHLLYIATGRARGQIAAPVLALGFDGVISSGGARIEAGEETLFCEFLPRPLLDRLTGYFNAHKTGYMVELHEKIFVDPCFRSYFKNIKVPLKWLPKGIVLRLFMNFFLNRIVSHEGDFDPEKVHKLVFMESEELKFEDVEQKFKTECEVFRNSFPIPGMSGGEITPLGIHKGSAVERVIRYHRTTRENTIAIGDSDNDRTMLKFAGIGIAMGNGDKGLKQIADDVTDSVGNAGLAKAFKKYGLVDR
jgi:Cof subfamily protein (haloacid dehalogenase superfamily)